MRFKHKILITGLALFMGVVGLVGEALAQPAPNVYDGGNMWRITAYDDCNPVHQEWATQCICYLPYTKCATCGIRGVWYSCSFPNWRGRWQQEGDRVLMHGDYAGGDGHDGMVIDLFAGTSPNDEGAGQWTEWRETLPPGTTIGFLNTRLRRVGKCPLPPATDISKMNLAGLEKLAADLSSKVKPRLRKDGKPATSPADPEQVPLPDVKPRP